LKETLDEWAA